MSEAHRSRPPSEATLAWVRDVLGAGSRIVGLRRLAGGQSHANHVIDARDGQGRRRRLVLRRWTRPGWADDDPDFTAEREASALALLESASVPAPRLLAFDPDGTRTDVPAILETLLPGRRIVRPRDAGAFAERLARPLAAIHEIGLAARGVVPDYRRFYEPATLVVPDWALDRRAWARAIELAHAPVPASMQPTFIHRDYHQGNTLWIGDRLGGVVDWTSASWGPPEIDLGHMRWNLAAAFGRPAADRFLAACRTLGLAPGYSPEWDIRTTLDVLPELRPGKSTLAELRRTEEHVARALAELG